MKVVDCGYVVFTLKEYPVTKGTPPNLCYGWMRLFVPNPTEEIGMEVCVP